MRRPRLGATRQTTMLRPKAMRPAAPLLAARRRWIRDRAIHKRMVEVAFQVFRVAMGTLVISNVSRTALGGRRTAAPVIPATGLLHTV
jgi:hypothetical protein